MQIERPTAILNPAAVKRNIARMAEKASSSGVRFRPHFKTHQSAVIGEWFKEAGVSAITVSSVDMAMYFAENGWRDITIGFPVNWLQIHKINELAAKLDLGLLVELPESIQFLQQTLTSPVKIWLKIDAGLNRTGIRPDDTGLLDAIAASLKLADKLTLAGLLTHSGQTYGIMGSRSIRSTYHSTIVQLKQVQHYLEEKGFSNIDLSFGDTPTCSLLDDFRAVNEIRPGNFVFYDMQQVSIGSCSVHDVAVAVACPVVAKHPWKNTVTIYGGAIYLSKDYDDTWLYGAVALPAETGWTVPLPNTRVTKLSQEHGIIQTTPDLLSKMGVGDVLMILPVHSCLTVDALKHYLTPDGDVIAMMRAY